jgi:prolyl-tRNA synthetase
MLTVKEWMELVEYRITEGDSYLWKCFGDSAFSLSAWNGDQDGWSMNMVFDTQDQTVYIVEVCDYARNRAYRMINPDFQQAYDDEAATHGTTAKQAWDDVDYIDLEIDEDFVAKATWIKTDQDYDTRVSVPLTVPDDALFELMKQAHEQDITLNQLVENILRKFVDQEKTKAHLSDDEYWDKLAEEDDHWDDLAEDDHWDDEILEDEAPKKKKRKKSK